MKTADLQQCISGFKTVEVIGGPMIVRVHEALDAVFKGCKHRYFISVDFKFKEYQALNIGNPGLLGDTKTEATRAARDLAARIGVARNALDAAKAQAERWDTFTNRFTVRQQEERFNKIVGRYTAEFI